MTPTFLTINLCLRAQPSSPTLVEIFQNSWKRIVKDVLITGPRSEGCSQVAELNNGRFDGEERNGKNPYNHSFMMTYIFQLIPIAFVLDKCHVSFCFFLNPIFIIQCQKIKRVTFFDSQDEINARENLYRYKCTNTWKIFSESEYLEALFDDRSANKDGKLLNILQAFANKGKLVS